MAVWKIGSRWGNCGQSVLDLFLNYECAFIGNSDDPYIGHCAEVNADDFFVIADGSTPVALGKAHGPFQYCNPATFLLTPNDRQRLEAENLSVCPMSIILLPPEKRQGNWGIDRRRRICRYHANEPDKEQYIRQEWERLCRAQSVELQILPRTVSLFSGENSIFSKNVYYRVPKFQRPYSWDESQLRKLLENLKEAVSSNNATFIGTMQLSQPMPLSANGDLKAYNIIDGQQRITTFLLLKNLLEGKLEKDITDYSKRLITWVNKGEEQKKFNSYNESLNGTITTANADNNIYIQNYLILDSLLDEYFSGEDSPTIQSLDNFLRKDKVKIVVIETHAGLSKTLQIFNTINTAGLDLGTEDLFKIRFYEYRKKCGDPEQIFDSISDIYAQIEAYNAAPGISDTIIMSNVLCTYQRILIAKHNLSNATFSMAPATFFEQLFDTLLGIRTWGDFRNLAEENNILQVSDLAEIVKLYQEYLTLSLQQPDFRIIRRMMWETRYGYIWDMPIIARFFEKIQPNGIHFFTLQLFKMLCPPSLYFAKTVYAVRATLLEILKALPDPNSDWRSQFQRQNDSNNEKLDQALTYPIAESPKWKNLICRLVEYLKSAQKDDNLYTRLWSSIDIEHIQCYTDEDNCEQVQNDWGDELNRLGNLAILESSLNRSIKNRKADKPSAYSKSAFISIQELQNRVGNWTKEDAERRRRENSDLLKAFILS